MRRAFAGTGPFPVLAVVAAAVGTMFLVLTLNSIGGLVWTGAAVRGDEESGLVYYSYRGHVYTVDDVGSYRTGPRTVYVDPSHPARATLNTTISGTLQAVTVIAPYAAALGFAGMAVRRKLRYSRRRRAATGALAHGAFGSGVDEDTMALLLERQRAAERTQRHRPPASSPWERPPI